MRHIARWVRYACIATLVAGTMAHGQAANKPSKQPDRAFWGICYGPHRGNQTPKYGEQPTEAQIGIDMPWLSALTTRIRTYGVAGTMAKVPEIAGRNGLKTWVGGWIGSDEAANEREIKALVVAAKQKGVEAVVVGNEVLHRGDISAEKLLGYITDVKKKVQDKPKDKDKVLIAYADTPDKILSDSKIVEAVDVLLVNIHPYWDGVSAAAGPAATLKRFAELKDKLRVLSDKTRLAIGEVGWPSDGAANGKAVPSPETQGAFVEAYRKAVKTNPPIEAFYFQAYDEFWKITDEGSMGDHWGIYNADGSTKRLLASSLPKFDPETQRFAAAGEVLAAGKLMPGLTLDADTTDGGEKWVTFENSALKLAYPGAEKGRSVSVTVGKPGTGADASGVRDYSRYTNLVLSLKSDSPDEKIRLALKCAGEPSDGDGPTAEVTGIGTEFNTFRICLNQFENVTHPKDRLTRVHSPIQFLFDGQDAHTIYVTDMHFDALGDVLPVYVKEKLEPNFDMGADLSSGHEEWIHNRKTYMECSYPSGKDWGAVFITTFPLSPDLAARSKLDVSEYQDLAFELKGETGHEQVHVGVKTFDDPDNGREPLRRIADIPNVWTEYKIHLADLKSQDYPEKRLKSLYVVFELVFRPGVPAETVCFRNVRFVRPKQAP